MRQRRRSTLHLHQILLALLLLLLLGCARAQLRCRTVPTKGGTRSPEPCVFPFTFKGRVRSGCITDEDDDGRPWCSVQVDRDGVHIPRQRRWGHCDPAACGSRRQVASASTPASGCRTVRVDDHLKTCTLHPVKKILINPPPIPTRRIDPRPPPPPRVVVLLL